MRIDADVTFIFFIKNSF